MLNQEKRSVLLHGYGEDWPSDPKKPDLVNQLQIGALSALVRRQLVSAVFLGAGHVDANNPTIAAVMKGYLDHRDLNVPVVVKPPRWPASTRDEMRAFRDQSQEAGWNNCLCIGIAGHGDRIQRARDRIFPTADYMSTEDVLVRNADPLNTDDYQLITLLTSAGFQDVDRRFRNREKTINFIDSIGGRHFDIGGRILDLLNRYAKGIKKLEVKMGQ